MAATNGHARAAANGSGLAAHEDVERDGRQKGRIASHPTWRTQALNIIEDFSFLWFAICMNTGILSILLHQNPYLFHGIGVLSTITFVFNLLLFITLCSVLLLRIFLFPRVVYNSLKTDLTELAMTGAIPIALLTLVAEVGLTVSTAHWGGHAFTIVAYVLWWIGTALMFSCACFVFIMLSKYPVTSIAQLTPALMVPFVGTNTDAVVGALIVSYSADVSARIAVPVIIVSYLQVGVGVFASIIITSNFFARLVDHGFPAPAQSPALFLLVAPPGQAAAALLLLGSAAQTYFPQYLEGSVLTQTGGAVFAAAGALLALLFIGLAVILIVFALYHVLEVAWQRKHEYSLIWWGIIFPLATVNTAWVALAASMNSPTFSVLSSIFLIALFIMYFVNWAFTLYHIFTGRLLNGKRPSRGGSEQEKAD